MWTRIKHYPQLEEQYEDLLQTEQKLYAQIIQKNNQILQLQESNSLLTEELDQLRLEVNRCIHEELPDIYDSEYWNNIWSQSVIYYPAPKKQKVQKYLAPEKDQTVLNLFCDELIQKHSSLKNYVNTPDLLVGIIFEYMISFFDSGRFKYLPEDKEIWNTPSITLSIGFGDCDDYSIAMYSVIRTIFSRFKIWEKNRHRLKCVAGNVNQYGTIPYPNGSHLWLIWLSDNTYWYGVDLTYYCEISLRNFLKQPIQFNKLYGTIWFTFNEKYCWSTHNLSVTSRDWKKYVEDKK